MFRLRTVTGIEYKVNKDQVSGKTEQALGKVKQSVGETLGNEKLANQGVVDQAKGAAKETWGNPKDAAKDVRQSHQNAANDKAHERRNKLSQSVNVSMAGTNDLLPDVVVRMESKNV
jgi:uncharacterized protein YjbJ (UPF0337 family)